MKAQVTTYTTVAWCVRIVPVIGAPVRLTTYPVNLIMSNSNIYYTDSGYEQTSFTSGTSMSPAAIDLTGFIGLAGVTRDQIASGVFDNARVYIFKCNFLSPVEDYEEVTSGFLGKTTIEDDRYTIQAMSLIDVLGQSIGKTYSASCSRTFGSSGCQKSIIALTSSGSITHVVDSVVVRDSSRVEINDYFGAGTIQFTSGLNAGLKPLEIKQYSSDGTIVIFEPFYYTPVVGDNYTIIPGCRKRLEDCRDKWNNIINFFGFSYIPTQSNYQQVAGNR